MHGDHLATHGLFTDFAYLVEPVTLGHGVRDLRRDDSALDLPIEEVAAGVAAPQGAIAIKDRDVKMQRKDRLDKSRGLIRDLRRTQNAVPAGMVSERNSRA